MGAIATKMTANRRWRMTREWRANFQFIARDGERQERALRARTRPDHCRLAQFFKLAARNVSPCAAVIQLEISLPVTHRVQKIAAAFGQKREIEVRIGIIRVEAKRRGVVLFSLREIALLVVEIAQIVV